jgi:hypothetical protein
MRASPTRLGPAARDLDDPLGRQARGTGLDQAVDDLPVAKLAHLRVRQRKAAEPAVA